MEVAGRRIKDSVDWMVPLYPFIVAIEDVHGGILFEIDGGLERYENKDSHCVRIYWGYIYSYDTVDFVRMSAFSQELAD